MYRVWVIDVSFRFHAMNLQCLQESIKEHLIDIVTEFHKDIEATQNVMSYIYTILIHFLIDL